jgi:DNA replication and repair protein RecF
MNSPGESDAQPDTHPRVSFARVTLRDYRNIHELELLPAAKLNVVAGDNGQGKTSLLEALYLVATSRSFRTESLRELVRDGSSVASVRATVLEGREQREQRAVLGTPRSSFSIDGKRPRRLSDYATRTPVVVFHPGDLALANGPASERRTMLDRVALFLEPVSGDDRARFSRALRERQRILEERGIRAPDLDAFEQLAAEHGARLAGARSRSAAELVRALEPAFSSMAPAGLALTAQYRAGGTEDAQEFALQLARLRATDQRRGAATFGPQKDELELAIDGRSARHHASQGQQRVLTLALKLAELSCIRRARRVEPVLLLDDISSELDPSRTGAVYESVRTTQSQIFVTTTRPELFTTPEVEPGERADWRLVSGRIAT